jgi:hypothetical protein
MSKPNLKAVALSAPVAPVVQGKSIDRDDKGVLLSGVFSRKLSGFVTSQKTQRDNLQSLIVAGLEQYAAHGNTVYLTSTLEKCIGVKSLPTASIKEYIKAHADVKWTKSKDGKNVVFAKSTAKGVERSVTMPDTAWYNHESKTKSEAKADTDGMASLKATYNRLTKLIADGKLKADSVVETQKALAALKPFVA